MKKYGFPSRRRSEARLLAIKGNKFESFKYYAIDNNFFSSWTPQMAWVLGILFTDGCLSIKGPSRKMTLSSMDIEILEKVNYHLKSDKPIASRKQSYDKSKYNIFYP